jgi:sugar phosphate permease
VTVVDPYALEAAAPVTPRGARDLVIARGWLVGVVVYVTAAFHRASLGVAGLDAAERFGVSAGALSIFVVLQLGMYAVMQVPTGLLVDRFGPRRLLLAAACIMGAAQVLFSIAPSFPMALGARALLGVGDALTFVSLLRYVSNHFSARRFPLLIGLTGTIGAVGSIVATVPLSRALQSIGWTPSFAGAALASFAAAIGVWFLVPVTTVPLAPAAPRTVPVLTNVQQAWAHPATRAGFWVHFSTMSFTAMLSVLWGQPFLIAQGFSRSGASAVLTMSVLMAIISSLLVGAGVSRRPAARVPFALGVAFTVVCGWAVLVLGFGGRPPHVLVVIAVVGSAIGGPASAVGFALARDYNPAETVGTASGLVNVGGFSATIVASVAVGRVLDFVGNEGVAAYRLAFGVAIAVVGFGAVQALVWYRRLRAEVLDAQGRGERVPVPATRHRWDIATVACSASR